MKLYELIGVKKHHEKSREELVRFLDKFTPLKRKGNGLFAEVFEKDGTIYKFWGKDSSYDAFIDYCAKATTYSDNLPKFLSKKKQLTAFHKRSRHAPDKLNYIKMEKLEPFDMHHVKNFNAPASSLFSDLNEAINLHKVTFHHTYEIYKAKHYIKALQDWMIDEQMQDDDYRLPVQVVAYIETAFDIFDKLGHATMAMDISMSNVMMRGDTIVITDPVAEGHDRVIADVASEHDWLIFTGNFAGPTKQGPRR